MHRNILSKLLPKKLSTSKAFTLVEVLMAMVILLFGLLAVASMQVMSMRGNQHARETTERTTTVDNIMQWIISHNFDANNLRVTEGGVTQTAQHLLTIDNNGNYTLDDGDATDGEDDTQPPSNLIPPPDRSRNRITSVQWRVSVGTYLDIGTTTGSYDANDTITSKRLDVTVNWEGGGSTQITNIMPRL